MQFFDTFLFRQPFLAEPCSVRPRKTPWFCSGSFRVNEKKKVVVVMPSKFRNGNHFLFCICRTLKGGDPSAGSPTDTLLQLSPPREILNRPSSERMASSKPHSAGLMGGVCKTQGLIHRAIVTRDYWGFHLHEGGLQPSIRTKDKFLGLPYPFGLETHCLVHCMPRVAQEIRAIQIYRCPLLPQSCLCSLHRVLPRNREIATMDVGLARCLS